jgi:hypothetical protein
LFDDGDQIHVFCTEKISDEDPPRKYLYTSFGRYSQPDCYTYRMADPVVAAEVTRHACRAFTALRCRDYAKFVVRIAQATGATHFTDVNPNTAFGPRPGLPFTEVLQLHGITFSRALAGLMTKHARRLQAASQAS